VTARAADAPALLVILNIEILAKEDIFVSYLTNYLFFFVELDFNDLYLKYLLFFSLFLYL